MTVATLAEAFADVADPQHHVYANDPAAWIVDTLSDELWSGQRDICDALATHDEVIVRSAHNIGKSWLAARLVCWWLASHPRGEGFVVTSAPTFHQVRAILWREIAHAHTKANLFGRLNRTEWLDGNKLVAFGRKPSDYEPTAFLGIHAGAVLVVLDEAGGIPKDLWDAADSLVSNEGCKLLAIGNPDAPGTEFASRALTPDAARASIRISAWDSPNFTDETVSADIKARLLSAKWVETQRRRWHEGSSIWQSKIEAEFPDETEDGLFKLTDIAAARTRELEPERPVQLACDVARFGKDETVVIRRQGNVADIVRTSKREDTMATTGRLVALRKELSASIIRVDAIGVGGGVVDRLDELGEPVWGLDAGMAPVDPRFLNCRAEWYWQLRERFEAGTISIPDDDDLAAQLGALRYEYTSRGKIKIESKDDMAKRDLPSPDRADALMMAFATEPPVRAEQVVAEYDDHYEISEV